MVNRDRLDAGFLAEAAARLAGHDWPVAVLEQLTRGGGRGLVSAMDDLLAALRRLGDEDFADVAPAAAPFRETGQ